MPVQTKEVLCDRDRDEYESFTKVNSTNGTNKAKTIINTTNNHSELRKSMKSYWQLYGPTLESMMLSYDAKTIADSEEREILSYLPDIRGMSVLELGAGIGRYSAKLAQMTGHLTAVDFMETYTTQNINTNGHLANITFMCADVTKLDFPPKSFDLIFSNWLLMYLDDTEVEALFPKILSWLKPSGYFFFRESCYHPSGNVKRAENPTKYRTPLKYINSLTSVSQYDASFSLIFSKNVFTYVLYNGNPNQLCILAQKQNAVQSSPPNGHRSLQPSDTMSSRRSLAELSVGKEFFKNVCTKLEILSGQRVLHLFSGTGELSFSLVGKFNVFVHAVEESAELMQQSIINQDNQDDFIRKKIQFECRQLSATSFLRADYDGVICVTPSGFDSRKIFNYCKDSVKQGGKLLLIDCLPTNYDSNEHSSNTNELRSLMESCGFSVQIDQMDNLAMTMMEKAMENRLETNTTVDACVMEETMRKEIGTSKAMLQWIIIMATKL